MSHENIPTSRSSRGSEGSRKSNGTKSSKTEIVAKESKLSLLSFSKNNAEHSSDPKLQRSGTKSNISVEKEEIIKSEVLEVEVEEKPIRLSQLTQPPPKISFAEYQKRSLDKEDLFSKVITLGSTNEVVEVKNEASSILVTGFGMRNLQSLQNALEVENKRLHELYKHKQKEQLDMICSRTPDVSLASTASPTISSRSKSTTASSATLTEPETMGDILKLQYLMGLPCGEEEGFLEMPQEPKMHEQSQFNYSRAIAMREAQQYLVVHRIFDFIRFIIAHLLGSAPDNPINYILELLNKCLLYRSGAGNPPLLYETRHIAQLFALMDRINAGFIDMDQYTKGMNTLGLCEFNKTPEMTEEGISKETFVREVYEAEINLFDDLIRRKYVKQKEKKHQEKPINYNIPTYESKTAYFIPSDLFKSIKHEKLSQVKEETEG